MLTAQINSDLALDILFASSRLSLVEITKKQKIMNINSILLFLLVVAAYLNLYLKFKKIKIQKEKTKLPISSKEWREKLEDENFKLWLSNRERLKDKKKDTWKDQTAKCSFLIVGLISPIPKVSQAIQSCLSYSFCTKAHS